jgi:CRP/FNR family cyclic AMP-dependent transcriptional regulator
LELADRLRQRAKFQEPPNDQPILFIGSSAENLPIAREIQSGLSHDRMEVIVWTDGVFRPSAGNVERVLSAVKKSDFAALVLSPDDTVICRDVQKGAPPR